MVVSYQVKVGKDGVAPRRSAAVNFNVEIPVTILIHHFDRCFVEHIVRIVDLPGNEWGLDTTEMDHPEHRPWFLLCGLKDTLSAGGGERVPIYLVINDDFEFYPVVQKADPAHPPSFSGFRIEKESEFHRSIDYSETDRVMVEAAIQSFLRSASWVT